MTNYLIFILVVFYEGVLVHGEILNYTQCLYCLYLMQSNETVLEEFHQTPVWLLKNVPF